MATAYVLRTATSPGLRRVALPKTRTRTPKLRRTTRITIRTLAIAVLGLLLFTAGHPLSPAPSIGQAHAGILDFNICDVIPNVSEDKIPNDAPMAGAWPGSLGSLGLTNNDKMEPAAMTGYDKYGTALGWNRYPYQAFDASCGANSIVAVMMLPLMNMLWQGIALITQIMMTIFGFAIGYDSFTPYIAGIGSAVKQLGQHLYLPYLTPLIMVSALWIGWRGLAKQRSSEALQGVLWTLMAATAAFIFFAQPTAIAVGVNNIVQTASHAVISIAPTPDAGGNGKAQSICTTMTTKPGQAYDSKNMASAGQCMIWETFYVKPWALGALGSASQMKDRYGTTATNNLMFATTVTRQEIQDKKVDTKAKNTAWKNLIDTLACSDKDPADIDSKPNKDCEGKQGWTAFTGLEPGPKIAGVMVGFLGDFVGALPLIILAWTQVFLSIMTVLLFLAAPFYLTLGIHPGFGRKIALSWVEMVIANMIKRIGTAGLIGLAFILMGTVTDIALPWIIQVAVIGVVGWGLLMFRGKFLKQISHINLGGDGTTLTSGIRAINPMAAVGTAGRKANHGATTAIAAGGAIVGARRAGAGMTSALAEGGKKVAAHPTEKNVPLRAAGGMAVVGAQTRHVNKVADKNAKRMSTYEGMDWTNPKPQQIQGLLSWANTQRKRGVQIPLPKGPQAAAIRRILYDNGYASDDFLPEGKEDQTTSKGSPTTPTRYDQDSNAQGKKSLAPPRPPETVTTPVTTNVTPADAQDGPQRPTNTPAAPAKSGRIERPGSTTRPTPASPATAQPEKPVVSKKPGISKSDTKAAKPTTPKVTTTPMEVAKPAPKLPMSTAPKVARPPKLNS